MNVEEDIFSRELIARKMGDMMCAVGVSPLILNGPWGCGKTTHALRLESYINECKKETHKCIYWNAAQNDFVGDPLPAFVARLSCYVKGKVKKEKLKKKGWALCKAVLLASSFNCMSQYLKHSCGFDLNKFVEANVEAIKADGKDDLDEVCFDQFIQTAAMDEQRIKLARAVINEVAGKKTLVVIIDELDRCRPDFALKTIEIVKHLFEGTRCIFLMVLNLKSLHSAISHVYGLSMDDAKQYLHKFFKLELSLPIVTHDESDKNCVYHYFEVLVEKNMGVSLVKNVLVREFMMKIINKLHLQLRDMERMVDAMKVVKFGEMKDEGNRMYCLLLACFISYLMAFENELMQQLCAKAVTIHETMKRIGFSMEGISIPPESETEKKCKDYLASILSYLSIPSGNILLNSRAGIEQPLPEYIMAHHAIIFSSWLEYSAFFK